ncbi:hypothetical protein [Flavobacterium sp. CGRL2]
MFLIRSYSRCPLQSFWGEPRPKKDFLPNPWDYRGWGHQFSEEKIGKKRPFQKKKQSKKKETLRLCASAGLKKNIKKNRLRALVPWRQNQAKRSKTAKIPIKANGEKNFVL